MDRKVNSPGTMALLLLVVCQSVFFVENLQAQIPTDGLIAAFPFNGNADDESGNGNHGTVEGAALTTDRFGVADKAYVFDGIDDYIRANADNLPTADRTVAFWFRADQLNSRPGLLGYGGGSCGTSWWMGANNGGSNKQYQMQGHCLANLIRTGYGPPPLDSWHHWLVTSSPAGTKLFVDGILLAQNNTFINNTGTVGKDFSIGVVPNPDGFAPFADSNVGYFAGRIDEVVIYSRSLETAEIAAVISGNLPSDYALFYPFENGAADMSANENDGFVVGPTLTNDRFGNSNSAYAFDGIDDYIIADADPLPSGERTIGFWFRADDLSSRPGLLGYGGGVCGTSLLMAVNAGSADNQYFVSGHCDANSLRASFAPEPVLSWQHLAMTTAPSGTRVFANGELLGSNDNYVTNTDVAGRDLAFGTIVNPSGAAPFSDVNSGYFDGKLDDILIYNRALSSDEIKALFYDGDNTVIFLDGFESGDSSGWM